MVEMAASMDVAALAVWMLGSFVVPAFWMQIPGDHYNPAVPAAILLALLGWRAAANFARKQWGLSRMRNAALGTLAVASVLFIGWGARAYWGVVP